jgi:predicted nucleotidyltransferase
MASHGSLNKIDHPEVSAGSSEYFVGLRRREAEKRQQRLDRHARAQKAIRTAAKVLRKRFDATRVRAFGSVLHAESFHLRSDIDIAVEGINPLLLLKAWCAISSAAPGFEFDLITPEECRSEVWAYVESEGVDV